MCDRTNMGTNNCPPGGPHMFVGGQRCVCGLEEGYAILRHSEIDALERLRAEHADCTNLSHAEAARILEEAREMRARAERAEAERDALLVAGESLWVELKDAAFVWEGASWKVQRDAAEALNAWRAALAAREPQPTDEGEA